MDNQAEPIPLEVHTHTVDYKYDTERSGVEGSPSASGFVYHTHPDGRKAHFHPLDLETTKFFPAESKDEE